MLVFYEDSTMLQAGSGESDIHRYQTGMDYNVWIFGAVYRQSGTVVSDTLRELNGYSRFVNLDFVHG